MATVVVAFDGATRINDADANTNWGNWPTGGGAPASEPQLRYQYTGTGSVGAVNTKVTSTTSLDGIDYDPGSGAVSMLTAANRLWFAKVIVADFADLDATYGVNLGIGSALTAMYEYNVAGSGANRSVYSTYPAQGGYLIVPIDPRIAAYRESTTGTPDLSAVDWFGAQCQMVNGSAKNENLAMDALDIGRGLKLTRGDGASTDGNHLDFVAWDQDTLANRYGVVTSTLPGVLVVRGVLTIGESATETTFADSTSLLIFPDGYHSAGSVGIFYDLSNALSLIDDTSTLIGAGKKDADQDTRPDLWSSGNSTNNGYGDHQGRTVRNFRRIAITESLYYGKCTFEDCGQITLQNGDYGGYQTLDGTGDYLSSSAAISHTFANGDFEIVIRAKATDWSPTAVEHLFDWNEGGSAERIRVQVTSGNDLELLVQLAGTNTTHTDTTILDNFIDGEWYWLRIFYDASAGQADFYYSQDPANTPPQDAVWIAGASPTGTGRTIVTLNATAYIGSNSAGGQEWTGDISYVSLWDGAWTGGLQVFMADWRTGPDFTGSPAARPDGIQSVNWEENGNPVYTLGDNETDRAGLDQSQIFRSTSYAAVRYEANEFPTTLNKVAFNGGGGAGHAIEFTKDVPSTMNLSGQSFLGYAATDGQATSAFYNNSGKALTLNLTSVTGNPKVRNGVGASTTINNTVLITLKGTVSGSQCAVYAVDDDSELMNEASTGADVEESYGGTTPRDVIIRVRKGDTHQPYVASGQIAASTGLTVTVDQLPLNV